MRKGKLSVLISLAGAALVFSACGLWSAVPNPPAPPAGAPVVTTSAPQALVVTAPPTETLAPPPPSPAPSPTQAPVLTQLTTGGCCVQPFWSPDGSRVLFVDQPSPDAPAGIYGVRLEGGEPELVAERLGSYSRDMGLLAFPQGGEAVVERLADGQRWTIPSSGRAISLSPDGTQAAWTAGDDGPPFDTPRREVWISSVDGSQPRLAVEVYGGGFAGWFPDGRLLFNGRLSPEEEQQGFFVWSPLDGSIVEITRASRLRGAVLSPLGAWLAYLVTLDEDPLENGLWLANTQTRERKRLELFGAYRWRDEGHLLVVPLDLASQFHYLWEVEAASGQARQLTDPALTQLRIANGDWTVSPDGKMIAFVSAEDQNIWLLGLP